MHLVCLNLCIIEYNFNKASKNCGTKYLFNKNYRCQVNTQSGNISIYFLLFVRHEI